VAKRRISMKKIREIIRLHEIARLSNRKIAKVLDISRPVVSQYLSDFKKTGLSYYDIESLTDDRLKECLNCNTRNRKPEYEKLSNEFNYLTIELKKPGVTLYLLWEEYLEKNPNGYSYSQFCYHFQVWRENSRITMHIEHKAGDKTFVDFAGKKLSITNMLNDEITDVEVFVAVLGASGLTYVEAAYSQKKEDWILLNENAFRYFGGVTNAIVPDCLKSGVTKGDKYEPDINPEYMDFSRHYDTVVLPARPNRPKDKALVENAVNIVYTWIYAELRNKIYYSLHELNKAIREKLEKYNNRLMQKLKVSRRELFEQIEKDALKPLPVQYYEFKTFQKGTVGFDYHIYLKEDKHYYSVPYRFRRKDAEIVYTYSTVEIYYNNTRIAFHKRVKIEQKYTTLPEHMPPNHRWMNDWNPDRLIRWGANIGPNSAKLISKILESKRHPEQGYKACLGVLNLEKKYSDFRLEKACARALYFQSYTCKFVRNTLINKLEEVQEELDLFAPPLPVHKNIRGKYYYG
jgi:transposase